MSNAANNPNSLEAWARLDNTVLDILLHYDPLDINYETARVEYSPAAACISAKVRDCSSEEATTRMVQEVLLRSFDIDGGAPIEHLPQIAKDIWRLHEGGNQKQENTRGGLVAGAATPFHNPIPRAPIPSMLLFISAALFTVFVFTREADSTRKYTELETRVRLLESQKRWPSFTWHEQIVSDNEPTTNEAALRLWNQTDTVQVFHIQPPPNSRGDVVAEAWLTDWSPRSEIMKFDEFRVLARGGKVLVTARRSSNQPISMDFWVTAVFQ